MKNQSVSDFVASTMDAVLNSKEHKAMFGGQYKYAQDMNDAKNKCSKCDKSKSECKCDSSMADDFDARFKKKDDESSADDDQDARKKKKDESSSSSSDSSSADDQDAKKKKDKSSDESSADDDDAKKKKDDSSADDAFEMEASAAYDVAIDSLLTASAALDSVGLGRGSAFSLKLASLVVVAKKKEKDAKKDSKEKAAKEKAKEKASKEKEKKDTQMAKDKEKALKEKEKEKLAKEKERLAKEKAKASSKK